MKKLLAYTLLLLAVVSCLQEERSPEDVLIPSPAQVDCSEAWFSLTSKVPNGSEKLVEECGFLVGTTKDFADAVTVEGTMTANAFAAELPMRKYGTTYYICSYVTNGHGSEIRSDVRTFALESLDKYVKFGAVTVSSYDMASKTTELSLAADIWTGVEVSEAGLCYGESEVLSLEGDYAAGSLADDGAIYITINGFIDGDKYYLRPYLRDGEYLAYGDVVEFSIPAVPVVKTYDAAEVTSEGAVLSGEVVKGADISERGFMFAEGESSAADMKQKKVVEGTIGEYTLALEGLLPNQKYTYCAYAVNPTGTYYGPVKSFTTKIGLPVVASVVASSITSTSATLSATVKSHGGETVSEVGFYYSTEESVDIETATKVNKPYSESSFDLQANELAANTKYYVKAYAVNSAGVGYSQTADFTTSAGAPSVNTLGATDVTSAGATLSGTVIADNGASITERGFVWMQGTGTPTTDSFKLKVDGTTGDFTSTLDGLEPNQKYSFRAYAINSVGTSYGGIMSLSTVASLPKLSAMKVSDITSTSAMFSCNVINHGGEIVSEVGFYYSKDELVDAETAQKISEEYSSDSFSLMVENLEVGQNYYVKAYAKNSAGEAYSTIVTFTVASTKPIVTTTYPSEITSSSAVSGGNITTDGGTPVTARGVVWSKDHNPTISLSTKTSDGTGTGSYVSAISGLEPGIIYYARAYATNSIGISYGDEVSFRTNAVKPTVITFEATDVTISSAKIGGNVTATGGADVTERGIVWSTIPNPTIENSIVKLGEGVGEFDTTLSNLEINTIYYVRAYAINSAGISYGEVISFETRKLMNVHIDSQFSMDSPTSLILNVIPDYEDGDIIVVGIVYDQNPNPDFNDNNIQASEGESGWVCIINDLYYDYCYIRAYIQNLTTGEIVLSDQEIIFKYPTPFSIVSIDAPTSISATNATINGWLYYNDTDSGDNYIVSIDFNPVKEFGIVWGLSEHPEHDDNRWESSSIDFNVEIDNLEPNTTYYVRGYTLTDYNGFNYGPEISFTTDEYSGGIGVNLSEKGTANSYIVSSAGTYSFSTVKGNSFESVGPAASAEVLWESYGTSEVPEVGSLVSSVSLEGDMIVFDVPEPYREGNAVIAAKDANGTILWSWHIWLTDQPQGHVYNNNAGTMMDRNLGATSATPGDVGALGLLYQWGRKDPFLGSSSISSNPEAKSSITWPSEVSSNSTEGTIKYATEHPTTFITYNSNNYDWYYTGSSSTDDTRWQSSKTIYDPCPVGWRVPDGGRNGVWNVAGFSDTTYDDTNKGISFSISSPSTTWYPASGYRNDIDGALNYVGNYGYYWSVTPYSYHAYYLYFSNYGYVGLTTINLRAYGFSVRCLQESK